MSLKARHSHAFTLVELLVVIAITAVLFSLLLPTLSGARVVARAAVCASQMRQHATMTTQYTADSKGFLPLPTSGHRLTRTNPTGSGGIQVYPSSDLYIMTRPSGSVADCPLGNPKTLPKGYGWFYAQGYLPPTVTKTPAAGRNRPLGILQCPGTQPLVYRSSFQWGRGWVDYNEFNYRQSSTITRVLSEGNTDVYTNPQGVSAAYCCYMGDALISYSDYVNRGWHRTSGTKYTGKVEYWAPGNAWAVDNEGWLYSAPGGSDPTLGWPKKHNNGINIGYIDGHAKFGAKDMSVTSAGDDVSVPPAVYYSMAGGQSYTAAYSSSNAGFPGATGGGDGRVTQLWTYYETGIP